jgi:hypothetical protein
MTMVMSETEFERHLLLYGPDIEHWPEGARFMARPLQQKPSAIRRIATHYRLEAWLNTRHMESSSPFLAERIIGAAKQIPQHQRFSVLTWLQGLCMDFRVPQPVYAVALTLLLGVSIGISSHTIYDTLIADTSQAYFIDDGAIP